MALYVYNTFCSLRNCVRVAQQTLTLFVWVRILVPQPKIDNLRQKVVDFLSNPKDWYVITRQRVCNRRRRMSSPRVHFPSD